jgi:hypothetical protein
MILFLDRFIILAQELTQFQLTADIERSPAFRAAEKDLAFYNNFNNLGMSYMKLVVAGSPDTHNLMMPADGTGGLKLVHHLRLALTVSC